MTYCVLNMCTWPQMSWNEAGLDPLTEWRRFKRHVQSWWEGPLHNVGEGVKIGYLKVWIGDEGRELFDKLKFQSEGEKNNSYSVLDEYEHFFLMRNKCSNVSKSYVSELQVKKIHQDGICAENFQSSKLSQLHIHNNIPRLKTDSTYLNLNESFEAKQAFKAYKIDENNYVYNLCTSKGLQCFIQRCHHCRNYSLTTTYYVNKKKQKHAVDLKIHTSCRQTKPKNSVTSFQRQKVEITDVLGIQGRSSENLSISLMNESMESGRQPINQDQSMAELQHDHDAVGDNYTDYDLSTKNEHHCQKINQVYMREQQRKPDVDCNSDPQSKALGQSAIESASCQAGCNENHGNAASPLVCSEKIVCQESCENPTTTKRSTSTVVKSTVYQVCSGNPAGNAASINSSQVAGQIASQPGNTGNAASSTSPPEVAEQIEERPHQVPKSLNDDTPVDRWPAEIIETLEANLNHHGPKNWKAFMMKAGITAFAIHNFSTKHPKDMMTALFMNMEPFSSYTIGQLKTNLDKMGHKFLITRIEKEIEKLNKQQA